MQPKTRLTLLRILALILVLGITILILVYRDRAQELAAYGYPGIFIFSVLVNATVLLPLPGNLVVFAMGGVLNPILVALAAGVGAAVGELSGYLAGFSGQAVVENMERYERLRNWLEKNRRFSDLAIFALACIPNPVFDMAGIAAGVLRIPIWRFLLFAAAGKFLNMLIFAYLGSLSLPALFKW
ncbi:MAG: VTT domain-containing protein [Anaerolineales bacterium]|nr:VTT domain-containing protein [Anaerolineales bacterium]